MSAGLFVLRLQGISTLVLSNPTFQPRTIFNFSKFSLKSPGFKSLVSNYKGQDNSTLFFFQYHSVEKPSSITQLLTDSVAVVAHSTRPSSRPKTNNQPLKKCTYLRKSCQKLDFILGNKLV